MKERKRVPFYKTLFTCDLHHNFDQTLTVNKFNLPANFSQFERCQKSAFLAPDFAVLEENFWTGGIRGEGNFPSPFLPSFYHNATNCLAFCLLTD